MRKIILAIAIASSISAFVFPANAQMAGFDFGGFRGGKLKKAIKTASAFPLGSEKNPVRVNMPSGQRQYLSRLRCANGEQPKFERGGSVGSSPFGSIVDVYDVDCGSSALGKVAVYLDVYHPKHNELAAVPGFTIVQ